MDQSTRRKLECEAIWVQVGFKPKAAECFAALEKAWLLGSIAEAERLLKLAENKIGGNNNETVSNVELEG